MLVVGKELVQERMSLSEIICGLLLITIIIYSWDYFCISLKMLRSKDPANFKLKERILNVQSTQLQSDPRQKFRPARYKDWDPYQLEGACNAVVNQSLSIRRAAEQFSIPKTTLHDLVLGKVHDGSKSGPEKYLSSEEDELAHFLCSCAEMGYTKSRQHVILLVQQVVNKKGKQVKLTHGWWESFR